MKYLVVLLFWVLAGNVAVHAQTGLFGEDLLPEWTEFVSETGAFRVLAPGEFTLKVDSIETKIGTLAYHTYFLQDTTTDADNKIYMVSYCDYPEATVHSDSTGLLADFFTETMEAAVFSIDGELAYWDEVELEQFPGRFWRVDYLGGQALIKTKAVLVKSRYYAVQTVMLKGKSMNNSSNRFLDSFRLTE